MEGRKPHKRRAALRETSGGETHGAETATTQNFVRENTVTKCHDCNLVVMQGRVENVAQPVAARTGTTGLHGIGFSQTSKQWNNLRGRESFGGQLKTWGQFEGREEFEFASRHRTSESQGSPGAVRCGVGPGLHSSGPTGQIIRRVHTRG